jgi:putative drug exporter of the RND superfamily
MLPAAMKLLGEWNWYMPRWLEWVPSLSAEERKPADEKQPPLRPLPH